VRANDGQLGETPGDAVKSRRPHAVHADVGGNLGVFPRDDAGVEKNNHSVLFRALVDGPVTPVIVILQGFG